jgi:putative Mn2+ efflux pump MntP
MSSSIIIVAALLGVDSFIVCVAVGALPRGVAPTRWLALSFALCDGLASLIGSMFGIEVLRTALPWSEWLGPAAVAAYGVYVLYLAWRCHGLTTRAGATRWLVFSLPICLSLDNLVAGMGTEASGVPAVLTALTFGGVSGGLALLGMVVGSTLGARRVFRAWWLGGTLLILIAGGWFFKEALS